MIMADRERIFQTEDGSECELVLTETHLTWKTAGDSTSSQDQYTSSVPICWIIAVQGTKTATDVAERSSFTIHYTIHAANNGEGNILAVEQLILHGRTTQCEEWRSVINEKIRLLCPARPRNVLVFINPRSGYGKGEEVFHKHVEPVFTLAGVNMDVIVTTESHHSTQILETYDLDKVDSIVAIGGDGTFSAVADALLKRLMQDAGLDVNDPDVNLVKPTINFGVIATGSSDGLSQGLCFSRDPLSGALTILMGNTRCKDVHVVHSGSKLVGYSNLSIFYGLTCNLVATTEKMRWLGPMRYTVAPLMLLFGRPRFDVEIDMKCAHLPSNGDEEPSKPNWHRFSGCVQDVSLMLINMRYVINNHPLLRIFSGERNRLAGMTILKTCGLLEMMRYFGNLKKPVEQQKTDYPFKEEYQNTVAFRLKATGSYAESDTALHVILDGEIKDLPAAEFAVRTHFDVLPVFTRTDLPDVYEKYTKSKH